MKLRPIADQLTDCGFAQVGGVLEWAGLKTAPGRLPAAFVVPTGDTGGTNRLDTGVDQRVDDEFSVILVLDAAARAADGVSDKLDTFSKAVRTALVGWTHPEAAAPTLYVGGQLLSADGATLAWRLRFRSAYHLRKVG